MKILLMLGTLLIMSPLVLADKVICIRRSNAMTEEGIAMKTIKVDHVVEVKAHPRHKDYYLLGQTKLLLKRVDFRTLEQVLTQLARKKIDLEGLFKQKQTSLQQIESDLSTINMQTLETERDSCLTYRVIVNTGTTGIGSYSYTSFLSQGKVRKALKKLAADKIILDKKRLLLQNESAKVSSALLQLNHRTLSYTEKLSGVGNGKSFYLITSDNAPLYHNSQIVKHLENFSRVKARPHPKHSNWHQVLINKKVYDISSKHLMESSDIKVKYASMTAEMLTKMNYLDETIKQEAFSILLLQGIKRQLESDKFLSNGYGIVKNMTIKIDNTHSFIIHAGNYDSVYVQPSRARKVLESWSLKLESKNIRLKSLQAKMLVYKKFQLELKKNQALLVEIIQ